MSLAEDMERRRQHVLFTEIYFKIYQEVVGSKYVHMGQSDGKALKTFIAAAPDVTPDQWSRIVRFGLSSRNKFIQSTASSIRALVSSWNRLVVAAGKPAPATVSEDEW